MRLRLVALFVILAPAPAVGQDLRLSVSQRLVGQIEPMGAEHRLSVGARAPLGDPDALIFTGAHAEVGVVQATSPIYAITGGYLQVSPIALLVLRAELAHVAMWPIGMPGAGYYAVEGDRAALGAENLPPEAGREASGWTFRLRAVLQGAVPLGRLRILLWDQLGAEHLSVGDAAFHFYPPYDAVLARNEWVITNAAMLLGEVAIDDARLRFGLYDDLLYLPRADTFVNQLGGIAALALEGLDPRVPELQPFARLGMYTHGRRAGAATFVAGVMVRYDVASLR